MYLEEPEMRDWFSQLADCANAECQDGEIINLWLSAETTDFVRFNRGKVRQPGSVTQRELNVTLVQGARHATFELGLSGDAASDRTRLQSTVAELRTMIGHLPEDPHLMLASDGESFEDLTESLLPESSEVVSEVCKAAEGYDFVGLYAAGDIHRAYASTSGIRRYFHSRNFNLDWSLYASGDKAVKTSYAGTAWDRKTFEERMDLAKKQVPILNRPAKELPPGSYRTYLAPSAVNEILGLLGWNALSLKAHRTKQTALLPMLEDDATLSPHFSLSEDMSQAIAPRFIPSGHTLPERVPMIQEGRLVGALSSPRSAREYDVSPNACPGEQPQAISIAPGNLASDDTLAQLGTGIYVSNLWYLNWSDETAGRITGMTRFATLWVENGEIVAPLNVMRFDDTIYRIFGTELEDLSAKASFFLDPSTYFRRATGASQVPGILLSDFKLTL